MTENPDSRNPMRDRGPEMARVSFRLTAEQLQALDARVDAGAFPNRSEAIRAGIREVLREQPDDTPTAIADGGQR